MINIYTDGSCIKDKLGGWGVVFIFADDDTACISGNDEDTTNSRMELEAIKQALLYLDTTEHDIIIHSDSRYAIGVSTWMNAKKNLDIVSEIRNEIDRHNDVKFNWVKGHEKSHGNNLADKLATGASARLKEEKQTI